MDGRDQVLRFIKSRFPYSKYAVLAELRLADAQFGADQYLEAIDSYRLFIKFHPTHEWSRNGYTSFRIGEAYYKQLPSDFWLFPPSYEKDQSSIEDAGNELKSFLDKYPDSPYRDKAKQIVDSVAKRLADHEWYVARYYWDRGKPMGTVLRLRRLLERYRGVGYDVEALWLLGRAYVAVGMPDRAKLTWTELVTRFPQTSRAGEARTAIATLRPVPAHAAPPGAPHCTIGLSMSSDRIEQLIALGREHYNAASTSAPSRFSPRPRRRGPASRTSTTCSA